MAHAIAELCESLNVPCTPAQAATLTAYVALLERWNATYNLTAIRDRAGILTQHIADCLALVMPLQRHCPHGTVLDVGSGGGLPGVVIATMSPTLRITCVDSVAKKAAFVRHVAGALQLSNLRSEHARVEQQRGHIFNVITSRAFASLADFVSLTCHQLAVGGSWVAMKGKPPTAEMALLPSDVDVFHVEQLTVPGLGAQRCLVWMRAAHQPR